MSDFIKVIIGLALWFFYFLIMYNSSWKPECSAIPGCGIAQAAVVAPPVQPVEEVKRAALDCQWSDANGFTNNGFEDFKSDILSGLGDNNFLEITGFYYEGEENNTDFEDIGLARADYLKTLFAATIAEDRIQINSSQLDQASSVKESYFSCADFNWIEKETAPTNAINEPIEILDDRAIIRFPYNSVEKDFDPKIDAYLETLASQLKENGGTVRLTGHTDDRGEAERNEILAHRRAKMIRDILRNKGVKRSQILTFTKGEMEPIASNDTKKGRHENRRVEVQVDQ